MEVEGMICPIWMLLSAPKTHEQDGKPAHGHGIATARNNLLTVRQRLTLAKVDAVTASALEPGKEKEQTDKLLFEVSEAS